MIRTTLKTAALGTALSIALGGIAAAGGEKPGAGVTVRPVESDLLEEKFQHEILYRALEELGYTVAEPLQAVVQTFHLAVASGDGDFNAVHWDPLHAGIYEESGGDAQMTRVGHYIKGALQGYLVDTASWEAGVRNLADLKNPAVAARFDTDGDGKADLAGCVPGWGCERVIEHHLTEYGLRDTVNHNQGAYNAIIADTIARAAAGEPVLYYTWTPFWVSGVLVPGENVQWLEVPYTSLPDGRTGNTTFDGKNHGFEVNEIRIIANNDFLAANPAAAKLFEVATLDINDVSAQNKKMRDGEDSVEDIKRHADEWIASHRELFDSWLTAARAAGS